MIVSALVKSFLANDARLIARDPMLRWLVAVPLFYGLLFRWLLPFIDSLLGDGVDLAAWFPLILSYVLVSSVPLINGMIAAFIMLDERDEGSLLALRVTPLPAFAYLAFRIAMPTLYAFAGTAIALWLCAIDGLDWPVRLAVSALAALWAPVTALFCAAFAENKLQGFAMLKLVGLAQLVPVAAYFIPEPLQWLFGAIPIYWAMKLHWTAAADGAMPVYILIGGVIGHLVWIAALAWKQERNG